MKVISEEYKLIGNAINAHLSTYLVSIYIVEDSDVGKTWDNFNGARHASYTFKKKDVGKQIIRYFRERKSNYHQHTVEEFWHFRPLIINNQE